MLAQPPLRLPLSWLVHMAPPATRQPQQATCLQGRSCGIIARASAQRPSRDLAQAALQLPQLPSKHSNRRLRARVVAARRGSMRLIAHPDRLAHARLQRANR